MAPKRNAAAKPKVRSSWAVGIPARGGWARSRGQCGRAAGPRNCSAFPTLRARVLASLLPCRRGAAEWQQRQASPRATGAGGRLRTRGGAPAQAVVSCAQVKRWWECANPEQRSSVMELGLEDVVQKVIERAKHSASRAGDLPCRLRARGGRGAVLHGSTGPPPWRASAQPVACCWRRWGAACFPQEMQAAASSGRWTSSCCSRTAAARCLGPPGACPRSSTAARASPPTWTSWCACPASPAARLPQSPAGSAACSRRRSPCRCPGQAPAPAAGAGALTLLPLHPRPCARSTSSCRPPSACPSSARSTWRTATGASRYSATTCGPLRWGRWGWLRAAAHLAASGRCALRTHTPGTRLAARRAG
jgi:hypothetical protein